LARLHDEPIENWDDDWLVVADEGGDPFIFARASGGVLHGYHGAGEWDARAMFPDLNAMTACLAALGAIVLDAGEGFTDEECNIREEYQAQACKTLGEMLGSASAAEAALRRLGWQTP